MVSTLRHKSCIQTGHLDVVHVVMCITHDVTCSNHHVSDGEWQGYYIIHMLHRQHILTPWMEHNMIRIGMCPYALNGRVCIGDRISGRSGNWDETGGGLFPSNPTCICGNVCFVTSCYPTARNHNNMNYLSTKVKHSEVILYFFNISCLIIKRCCKLNIYFHCPLWKLSHKLLA